MTGFPHRVLAKVKKRWTRAQLLKKVISSTPSSTINAPTPVFVAAQPVQTSSPVTLDDHAVPNIAASDLNQLQITSSSIIDCLSSEQGVIFPNNNQRGSGKRDEVKTTQQNIQGTNVTLDIPTSSENSELLQTTNSLVTPHSSITSTISRKTVAAMGQESQHILPLPNSDSTVMEQSQKPAEGCITENGRQDVCHGSYNTRSESSNHPAPNVMEVSDTEPKLHQLFVSQLTNPEHIHLLPSNTESQSQAGIKATAQKVIKINTCTDFKNPEFGSTDVGASPAELFDGSSGSVLVSPHSQTSAVPTSPLGLHNTSLDTLPTILTQLPPTESTLRQHLEIPGNSFPENKRLLDYESITGQASGVLGYSEVGPKGSLKSITTEPQKTASTDISHSSPSFDGSTIPTPTTLNPTQESASPETETCTKIHQERDALNNVYDYEAGLGDNESMPAAEGHHFDHITSYSHLQQRPSISGPASSYITPRRRLNTPPQPPSASFTYNTHSTYSGGSLASSTGSDVWMTIAHSPEGQNNERNSKFAYLKGGEFSSTSVNPVSAHLRPTHTYAGSLVEFRREPVIENGSEGTHLGHTGYEHLESGEKEGLDPQNYTLEGDDPKDLSDIEEPKAPAVGGPFRTRWRAPAARKFSIFENSTSRREEEGMVCSNLDVIVWLLMEEEEEGEEEDEDDYIDSITTASIPGDTGDMVVATMEIGIGEVAGYQAKTIGDENEKWIGGWLPEEEEDEEYYQRRFSMCGGEKNAIHWPLGEADNQCGYSIIGNSASLFSDGSDIDATNLDGEKMEEGKANYGNEEKVEEKYKEHSKAGDIDNSEPSNEDVWIELSRTLFEPTPVSSPTKTLVAIEDEANCGQKGNAGTPEIASSKSYCSDNSSYLGERDVLIDAGSVGGAEVDKESTIDEVENKGKNTEIRGAESEGEEYQHNQGRLLSWLVDVEGDTLDTGVLGPLGEDESAGDDAVEWWTVEREVMMRLRHEEERADEGEKQKRPARARPTFGMKTVMKKLERKVGDWLANLGGLEWKTAVGVFEGRLFY